MNPSSYRRGLFSFQDIALDIYEYDGQIFLKGEDLGRILCLADPKDVIHNIFVRHRDELYPHSTTLKLRSVDGKVREIRCFNETGPYLVAMFARTPKAKEVRLWLAELPKKVREFGKTVQEDIQQALEEAREQGRLDALKELAAKPDKDDEDLLDEIIRLANVDDEYPAPPALPDSKAIRAAYELSRLNLLPEVLDRLLLYWLLNRDDEDTFRALSMRIEEVETVFSLFQALGFPRQPNLLPTGLPWEEPLKGISRKRADLERVEHRLRDLVAKVRELAGGPPGMERAFALLHEICPPWMIVTPRKVHLTKDILLALKLRTRTMADLARALGWGVSYLKGPGSGFRTITLSRKDFYARYIKGQTPALPAPVEATSAAGPSTRGKAMADWIQRTWEESNSRYKIWLERQFIKAFPEAKGTVGFI